MRISRIARPGALYDASVSAQTFGCAAIAESVVNPIDSEDGGDENVAKVIEANSYSHMPGFEDPDRKFPKEANPVNLLQEIKSR